MQKYDGEQKTCLKILEEFIYNLNNAKGDVKKGVKMDIQRKLTQDWRKEKP